MDGDSFRIRRARKFILIAGGVLALVSVTDIAWHGAGALNLLFLVWGLLLWVPCAFFGPQLFERVLKWLARIMEPLRWL